MPRDSRHKWYLLDMLLFIGFNALMLSQLVPSFSLPPLKPYQFIIFALAVYRGSHIVAVETITKPLRRPFVTTFKRYGKEQEKPRERGFRGAFGALITCPSCVGVWLATFFVYGFLLAPNESQIIMTILALSAIERFIARILEHFQQPPKYT